MRDIVWLIRKTLISTFKDYKSWLLYIGLPIAVIALAFITRGGPGDIQLNVGIVNGDSGQAITEEAIGFIMEMDSVIVHEISNSDVNDRIISGELDAAIQFPADFAQSVIVGNPKPVEIYSVRGADVTGLVQTNLNFYIDNLVVLSAAAGGDSIRFEELYAKYRDTEFSMSVNTVEDQYANYSRTNQTIGYLIVLMLFSAATLSGILIKERENRTYLRIIASPVVARNYVFANIVVNLAVMVVQIAVTMLILTQVFRVDPGVPYRTMFLLLSLFSLVAVSFSMALSAFSKSSQAVNASLNILIIPTSLIAGCMFPIELMPETIQKIANLMPQYWLLDMFRKLQLGSSLGSVYVNLLILAAFALAFTLLTIYKFGRNNDTRTFV